MECFSGISFCVWGPILDGGSKIDKLVSVMPLWGIPRMEILEPVRNGMPAPLEVKSCRLLTGRGFLTGWRESDPPCRPAATRSHRGESHGEAGAIQREKVPDTFNYLVRINSHNVAQYSLATLSIGLEYHAAVPNQPIVDARSF